MKRDWEIVAGDSLAVEWIEAEHKCPMDHRRFEHKRIVSV